MAIIAERVRPAGSPAKQVPDPAQEPTRKGAANVGALRGETGVATDHRREDRLRASLGRAALGEVAEARARLPAPSARRRRRGRRGSSPPGRSSRAIRMQRSVSSQPTGRVPIRPRSWLKPPTSVSASRRKDMLAPTRLRTGSGRLGIPEWVQPTTQSNSSGNQPGLPASHRGRTVPPAPTTARSP